ncbi:MAG: 50S ribosome-binding GTPase, partial [Planctomycetes bacterium]|nr:50S ribosome-binding GTPase [Planctomycetota bacterium]
DLGQAEAVERLVSAENEGERKAALGRLTHSIDSEIGQWRDQLVHIIASIEASLDFEEEEIDEDASEGIAENLGRLAADCRDLSKKASAHRPDREGVRITFAGLTNAGKSSLINALAEKEISIVSPQASTTRDRVAADVVLENIHFIFEDTPGYDPEGDPLGREASRRSTDYVKSSALICMVVDGSEEIGEELTAFISNLPHGKTLLILNKSDLPARAEEAQLIKLLNEKSGMETETLKISALGGEGIGEVKKALLRAALGDMDVSHGGRISAREAAELEKAAGFCDKAKKLMREGCGFEIVSEELRQTHQCLSRTLGEGYAEEALEAIFSRFCIGK